MITIGRLEDFRWEIGFKNICIAIGWGYTSCSCNETNKDKATFSIDIHRIYGNCVLKKVPFLPVWIEGKVNV